MKINLTVATIAIYSVILFISLASGSCPKCGGIKCSNDSIEEDYQLIYDDEFGIKTFDMESGDNEQFNSQSFEKGKYDNQLFNNGILFETNPSENKPSDTESADFESLDTEAFDSESVEESTPLLAHKNEVHLNSDRSINNWLKPTRNKLIVGLTALTGTLSLFHEGRMILLLFVLSHLFTWLCYFLINESYY